MIFRETPLAGAFVVEMEPICDHRGFFARTWCADEFEKNGLNPALAQCNLSYNTKAGTIRGMHFQKPPFEETKLVRCKRGSLFDVIIDIRPSSPTCGDWFGLRLSADERQMLYIPEGFAHGFQTLQDDVEVFYQMSRSYHPGSSSGVVWDDPELGIRWPLPVSSISDQDKSWPTLRLAL